jgi:hypothetical protein
MYEHPFGHARAPQNSIEFFSPTKERFDDWNAKILLGFAGKLRSQLRFPSVGTARGMPRAYRAACLQQACSTGTQNPAKS